MLPYLIPDTNPPSAKTRSEVGTGLYDMSYSGMSDSPA